MATRTMQAQIVLDSLPDLIREVVLDMGVDLSIAVPSADQPTNAFTFVPPDLQEAFRRGDHQKVDEISQKAAKDMDPIYASIQQHEDQGWVQIKNKSNDTDYWISIAGTSGNPGGYMWTYTNPKPVVVLDSNGTEPGYIHTVQVGTLSRNTKLLGISNQLWDNKALGVSVAAISTIVTTVLTRYISRRIAGTAFSQALSSAVVAAGRVLISKGIVTQASWLAGSVFTAKLVGGALVGAALTFLMMFIAEFVYRQYKCCINIYNWTSKDYTVTQSWGSNEKLDDDQNFVSAALPARSTTITLPDGMQAPVVGEAAVSYCTYVFVNVNKFLEGLVATMRVQASNESDGLLLGYYLGRFAKNRMALSSDTSQSLKDFWNGEKHLAPAGSLTWSITLADGTPVLCSTPALSGRNDQFYELNIQIGLKPAADFHVALPGILPRESRSTPCIPLKLEVGDEISLMDGSVAKVLGTFDRTH